MIAATAFAVAPFGPSSIASAATPRTTTNIELITPVRLLDTRPGSSTVDGQQAATGAIGAGTVRVIDVAGRGGIPDETAGIVAHIASTKSQANGHLRIFACDTPRPNTSVLSFQKGQPIGNTAFVELSATGTVCVYASHTTEVIFDVSGYLPDDTAIELNRPTRLVDTRTTKIVRAESVLRVKPIVDDSAQAAILNVTAVQPDRNGYATVYSCDQPRPLASNINYFKGQTIANAAIAQISSTGETCIYVSGKMHLVVDQYGQYNSSYELHATTPARMLDSRQGATTADGLYTGGGRRRPGTITRIPIAGRAGIPEDATAVTLNVAAVTPAAAGYLTVSPCDEPVPTTSDLNHAKRRTTAGQVFAQLSDKGEACIFNSARTDLVVDVTSYTTQPRSSLDAGASHTCTINRTDRVECWGNNRSGQLGDGTFVARSTPRPITGLDAHNVTTGANHTCAIDSEQIAYCWGDNSYRQLGFVSTGAVTSPTAVPNLPPITAITAGDAHTCALTVTQKVMCWGDNTYGQLGNGTTTASTAPVPVASLDHVEQISGAADNTCAVDEASTVYCWGNNTSHQTSQGDADATTTPRRVPLPNVASVAVGYQHVCALDASGRTYCWGNNTHGELGTLPTDGTPTPTPIPNMPTLKNLTAGPGAHTCGIAANDYLYCWGSNDSHQIDDTARTSRTPTKIAQQPSMIALGDRHTCTKLPDDEITCWGDNTFLQLAT